MARPPAKRTRRLWTWLVTGPAGHLLGGTLDIAEALARHAWRTRRLRARAASAPGRGGAAGADRSSR
jgi:hypothetical protein